jgi:hypothetical protein
LDDTGEYSCVYDESTTSKATLTVNELPIDFEKPLSNQSLTEYDTLTLECIVTKANRKVKWFFDNQELQADDRCRFEIDEKIHRLIITNMSPNDEGNYDVITESDRKSSAFISVKGKFINRYEINSFVFFLIRNSCCICSTISGY